MRALRLSQYTYPAPNHAVSSFRLLNKLVQVDGPHAKKCTNPWARSSPPFPAGGRCRTRRWRPRCSRGRQPSWRRHPGHLTPRKSAGTAELGCIRPSVSGDSQGAKLQASGMCSIDASTFFRKPICLAAFTKQEVRSPGILSVTSNPGI